MDAKTYQAQFGRTLANVFFPENVCPLFVATLLDDRRVSGELIDAAKRGLFYNKPDRLPDEGRNTGLAWAGDPEVLHAVLGMEGEVAELTEAAMNPDLTSSDRRARIIDEAGDLLWYMALLFKKHGISFEGVFEANIAKLKARYPDKFTVEAAVNRDLAAEAEVFEDNGWSPEEKIQLDGATLEVIGDRVDLHKTLH